MFVVNDDLSIYATRGDIVCLNVSATDDRSGEPYEFQPGDVLQMKIFVKKDAENVVLQKDFPVVAKTDVVGVFLTEQDTRIGDVISKPTDYWYEVTLNPYTNPQTFIGYDEDGAKIFKLFPEGNEVDEDEPIDPEDIPVVDTDLSLTSSRPVENKAIARAVALVQNNVDLLDKKLSGKISSVRSENKDLAEQMAENNANMVKEIAVERARIDNLVASPTPGDSELVDIRVGADGVTYDSAGTAVRQQISSLRDGVDNVDNLINLNESITNINKYNKNDARNREGYYFNKNGYNAGSLYRVTHPIYVKNGYSYKTMYHQSLGANNFMAFTDQFGNIQSYEEGVVADGFIVFTPSKSGFAVFNMGMFTADIFMVCIEDEYPESYNEYAHSVSGLVVEGLDNIHGKAITLNGDSICAGQGYSGGYGLIIANRNGMSYQNVAVNGGTVAAGTYSGSNERHWICRTIANMDANADFAIVEGGVNDSALGVPLGAITVGFTSELDDTTFYGAMESVCKQLVSRFAGKKVGFVIAHKMTSGYSSEHSGKTSYYTAAKTVCEKWGVPCLDLNALCPPLGYVADLKAVYTDNGDGWHPNKAGYDAYYVPKIEAWLRTL